MQFLPEMCSWQMFSHVKQHLDHKGHQKNSKYLLYVPDRNQIEIGNR